ncbi:hypothetical protein K432DRAFT_451201 [Lepidopterella palustris CBS 459.81]|uniref:Retrotransposon gag domain-containing protein n=1 Tax=Lepidopterella palustris CBS 459.81 TaxID=1314670 RepID=A0A8E2DWD4_9PEZI|nr:hypothetical protein K432DRAFT_451201 [Lepidopterella palustris CBS 459.81]
MAASIYLKGDALKWMQLYLRDYLDNHEDGSMRLEIDVIFKSYQNFKEALTTVFKNINKTRVNINKLQALQ